MSKNNTKEILFASLLLKDKLIRREEVDKLVKIISNSEFNSEYLKNNFKDNIQYNKYILEMNRIILYCTRYRINIIPTESLKEYSNVISEEPLPLIVFAHGNLNLISSDSKIQLSYDDDITKVYKDQIALFIQTHLNKVYVIKDDYTGNLIANALRANNTPYILVANDFSNQSAFNAFSNNSLVLSFSLSNNVYEHYNNELITKLTSTLLVLNGDDIELVNKYNQNYLMTFSFNTKYLNTSLVKNKDSFKSNALALYSTH
ncbi:hypothetical protein [Ligilactobacillus equi]|uniref:Phosphoglucomutase n=1 Tax=Ligilactobacillus equi DPC 6820 TaxID=1392007 RepID=V7HZ25_9LACO|nr:hypothetical protein [Ligilactobacillus equi]ETA74545.1 phosphoglucomutase [Ligilactobacillus equi DPC 6820]